MMGREIRNWERYENLEASKTFWKSPSLESAMKKSPDSHSTVNALYPTKFHKGCWANEPTLFLATLEP